MTMKFLSFQEEHGTCLSPGSQMPEGCNTMLHSRWPSEGQERSKKPTSCMVVSAK